MNASDYAKTHENVVVRITGTGFPAGADFAWLPGETDLPFRLEEIEGQIDGCGCLVATNLKNGLGILNYRFHDWSGNIIYSITLRSDAEAWNGNFQEFYGEST